MKKLILCAAIFFAVSLQAQTCSELVQYAKSEDPYPDRVAPYGSSMLAKAEYYEIDGVGLVIAYIKQNDYDFIGRAYIFCGISPQRWAKFKSEGMYSGSYGKSFHAYIMDYKCDC